MRFVHFVAKCGVSIFMMYGFVYRDDLSATCLLLPACSRDCGGETDEFCLTNFKSAV